MLAVVLMPLLARGQFLRWPAHYVDSAGFGDVIGDGSPNTHLRSNYLYSAYPFLWPPARDLDGGACAFVSSSGPAVASLWRIHPYIIAVPLGAVRSLLGIRGFTVGLLGIAGSAALAIGAMVAFLVRRGVPAWAVGLVAALVIGWPVFCEGLLGQAYFDRMFMAPGIIVVLGSWLTVRGERGAAPVAAAALLVSGLISERAALVSGLAALLLVLLFGGRRAWADRGCRLVVGAALLNVGWTYVWQSRLQNSPYYSTLSVHGFITNLHRLSREPGRHQLFVFLVFLVPLLVVVALEPRGLPVAALAVFPNLAVTVGGAELTGLSTHYHQSYQPIVVGLAAIGAERAASRWRVRRAASSSASPEAAGNGLHRSLLTFAPAVGCSLALLGVFAIWARELPSEGMTGFRAGVGQAFGSYRSASLAGLRADSRAREDIAAFAASRGVRSVSAPEFMAPALFRSRVPRFVYFPLGVGMADVVVAPYVPGSATPVLFPYGRPGWADDGTERCVTTELAANYSEIRRTHSSGYEVRVFQRKRSS